MIPLYFLFAGVIIGAIVVALLTSSRTVVGSPPLGVDGCSPQLGNPWVGAAIPVWVFQMTLGGCFFLLTVLKLHPYLRGGGLPTPFLTTFVRDGTLAYASIFVVELLDVIFVQVATKANRLNLIPTPAQWLIAVYGIAAPRLILNLRGVASSPSNQTTHLDTQAINIEEVELGTFAISEPPGMEIPFSTTIDRVSL